MLLKLAHTYRSSFSGLSRETWLLSTVLFINRCGTMLVPFMSMYITQRLHRSIGDAGWVITLFGIGAVLGSTVSGRLIDKLGFRPVQVFASITGGLLLLLFGHITHFGALCVLTLVWSFVAEAFRPANYAAMTSYALPGTLTRSYSLNRLGMNLGWGVGTSLGGVLAATDYHLMFWVEGTVYIFAGILILLLLPPAGRYPVAPATVQHHTPAAQPWGDRFLTRFLLLVTVYTTCFMLLFKLVPVYWKTRLHIGESTAGVLLGLNGLVIALFEMTLVRHWENKRNPMYYIVAGVTATASGYLLLVMPGVTPVLKATGSVLLVTVGEMMAMPFINAVVMKRSNEQNKGQYAAALALTWSVSNIAGPGGGAFFAGQWGYTALWLLLVALCGMCVIGFKHIAPAESRAGV
jgi:predicted MFS family arabinose efflux permease